MHGWLIVNEFIKTDRFTKLSDAFMEAASKLSVQLDLYTNADFSVRIDTLEVKSKAFDNGNPDFVIFYDKDIVLARALEKNGIKVLNSSESIRICDSKVLTMEALASKVRMPKTYIVPFTYENIGLNLKEEFLLEIEKDLSYPFIIKESYSSFGMGVHLVYNRKEAIDTLNMYGKKECSIQEFIGSSKGKDVRVFMVSDKCVASILRYSEEDFRSNAQGKSDSIAYKASDEMVELSKTVMKEMGLSFAGIDILFGENDEPILCEVNSNAHFLKLLECTGVNAAEEIIKYCIEK